MQPLLHSAGSSSGGGSGKGVAWSGERTLGVAVLCLNARECVNFELAIASHADKMQLCLPDHMPVFFVPMTAVPFSSSTPAAPAAPAAESEAPVSQAQRLALLIGLMRGVPMQTAATAPASARGPQQHAAQQRAPTICCDSKTLLREVMRCVDQAVAAQAGAAAAAAAAGGALGPAVGLGQEVYPTVPPPALCRLVDPCVLTWLAAPQLVQQEDVAAYTLDACATWCAHVHGRVDCE